ncbi:MAG: hypothetical protein ACOWWR_13615 [Eubacteriales bacterium]
MEYENDIDIIGKLNLWENNLTPEVGTYEKKVWSDNATDRDIMKKALTIFLDVVSADFTGIEIDKIKKKYNV